MTCVNTKVWFCDPLTCAASSGVRIRAPMRLSTLWLGWFEFCIVFLLSIDQWNKVSESRKRKANAIEGCSKKNSRFGKGLMRTTSMRTIPARELLWSALKRQPALFPRAQHQSQFAGMVDQNIRRSILQGMRRQTIGDSHGINPGIAGREHVNIGVADNNGFLRLRAGLFKQNLHACRIGLLGMEAVSAIDLEEIRSKAKRFHNRPRRAYGLVAEHGHFQRQRFPG